MPLNLVTAPTSEPITLSDLKEHAVVEITDDDALLSRYITAARTHTENQTQRALNTQTWDYYIDDFSDEIRLPKAPLQSVTSVKYIDSNGTEQTLASSVYSVKSYTDQPGYIVLAYDQSWPTVRDQKDAVTIRFVAGYSSVPKDIVHGMELLISHWEANRNNSSVVDLKDIPFGYEALISPYRVKSF